MTIEDLWAQLRREPTGAQRRVDAVHPLSLYAAFDQPDVPGIVVFTGSKPPQAPQLRAIGTEYGLRPDGKWSLRLFLTEPRLLPVFAELCRDIIEFTRSGVDPANAGGSVLSRLDRWQNLLAAQQQALSRVRLRGLIGELLFIENCLLPSLGADTAVSCWNGPMGASQDFQLPGGTRVEVKAVGLSATEVRINGLQQLDPGGDDLQLAVVRLEDTGPGAPGAFTAQNLVRRLRAALSDAPVAHAAFDRLLIFAGWDDDADTSQVVVRLQKIERFPVDENFPRLTLASVPLGIVDASYVLALPAVGPIT